MQKDRDPSFDAFRGVAIIAVIALHVTYLGGYWNSPFRFYCQFYCQLFNFAVPAFLFISGYWLSKKQIKSLADYKTFLVRRFSRIFIPYLFWSLVLIGYEVIKTHTVNVHEIIFKLILGRASFHYFFIIMIVQLYVITPLLQYINRKPYGLMLVLILNIMTLLLRYLSRLHFNFWFPSISAFYSWVIFYEIGLLLGSGDRKIFVPENIRSFILPAIFVSLSISEMEGAIILSKYNNLGFAAHALKYSSFLYSVCIIFGFLLLRERFRHWPKFLVSIGNYSFGIYLIHLFILGRVANIFQKINIIYSFQPLYEFIVAPITILICFVLISITRKLLPKSFCRKVLGF